MKRFLAYLFFVSFGIASLSAGEVETAFSPDSYWQMPDFERWMNPYLSLL